MERFFAYCLDFFGCLLGWAYFAPGASRVSARQPSYFFSAKPKKFVFGCWWGWVYLSFSTTCSLRLQAGFRPGSRVAFFQQSQKKVTKKKASHVRAASRSLPLLAAFGALANSLRSDNASALIRTLLRCSARPNGGGIPHGSSASRTSPEGLVRFAHLAGVGLPHSSTLTAHKGTARRAPTSSFLTPHPHSSLLTPHSLTPHSSLLTPASSPLTNASGRGTGSAGVSTLRLQPPPQHIPRQRIQNDGKYALEQSHWQAVGCAGTQGGG